MDLIFYNKDRKSKPDAALFLTILTIAGIGIAMCYSASAVNALALYGDSYFFLKRQSVWFLIGLVLLMVFQEIDYKIYQKYSGLMIVISLVLLVLVFSPGIGHTVKGSARWVHLGMINFQPSEFVKIAVILYLAKVFSSELSGSSFIVHFVISFVIVGVIFLLIKLQPDLGTAISILLVSALMFIISGFSFLYTIILAIASIPTFYLLIYQVDYRRDRILAYLNPWADRFGKGYHIIQSYIAFKRGSIAGVGLGFGTQKLQRLPEPHTDFIFAVIAEEVGLIGTVGLVIFFLVFFVCTVRIALAVPDKFAKLLAMGLGMLITLQAFINIGVVTGILPITGIPLPLVSYGGSSFLSTMVAGGILLNISRYREEAVD